MNYTPQINDIITREGMPPITIIRLTKASAEYNFRGSDSGTQPRKFFDDLLEKTLAMSGTAVIRDGVQIYPSVETKVSGSHNAHARLAPSSSKTWTNCTAAPAYVEANRHRVPADSSSVYSNEGTEAHDYAADILLGKKKLKDIPEDFQEAVGIYVDHCLAIANGVKYEVEVQVPLFYQNDQTGTCDFAIVTDERVTVRDYKHGAGVLVTSEENTQLAIYAYSMIEYLSDVYEFNDDTIIDIKVVQPRHRMADEDEAWILPLWEFRKFCATIEEKAKIATAAVEDVRNSVTEGADVDPKDVLVSSKDSGVEFLPQDGDEGSCRWCKAKGFCGARHSDTTGDYNTSALLAVMPDMTKEGVAAMDFEVVTDSPIVPKDGQTLRLDYLVAVFKNKKKIEKFLNDVQDYLETLAVSTELEGVKWVEGRQGNRSWSNEDEAEVFCKNQKLKLEERCTIKLKTPAQIEALLKENLKTARTKNRFEQLVKRSEGRPVLVPAEDKRPALAAPKDVMPDMTLED